VYAPTVCLWLRVGVAEAEVETQLEAWAIELVGELTVEGIDPHVAARSEASLNVSAKDRISFQRQ
jgi:hypothetical protein